MLRPTGEARIERGEWVLKHHLHGAPQAALGARAHHVPVDHDLSGRGAFQSDQQVGERALAAAAFAGDAEDASDTYVEADAVDRPHGRGPAEHGHAPGEVLVHVAKGHDGGVTAHTATLASQMPARAASCAHVGRFAGEMTGDRAVRANRDPCRFLRAADVAHERAARGERAAHGRLRQAGRMTSDAD